MLSTCPFSSTRHLSQSALGRCSARNAPGRGGVFDPPHIMTKLIRSFFRSGQRLVHQTSPKVKLCLFNSFLQIGTCVGNQKSYAPSKYAFDSSFNALSFRCHNIWPKINGLASREQNYKNNRVYEKLFLVIAFDSGRARHSFCH